MVGITNNIGVEDAVYNAPVIVRLPPIFNHGSAFLNWNPLSPVSLPPDFEAVLCRDIGYTFSNEEDDSTTSLRLVCATPCPWFESDTRSSIGVRRPSSAGRRVHISGPVLF